jgi:multidrug efflux system membrane fusion protein
VIRPVTAELHPVRLTTYGRTVANREVEVKARTAASVVSTPIAEGTYVSRGTVICRQDVDARQAVVDQAKAAVTKAEIDLTATRTLVEKGFRNQTQIATEQAALDAARAQLTQAETELGNIVMRAPFSGVFERQIAEMGDYLAPGQPCGLIVELNPLLIEAELTETQIGFIEQGQDIEAKLASGETVTAKVSYIEAKANPATRTFGLEARVPNSDRSLRVGVSATLSLLLDEADATLVPSGILALNEAGTTGIRYLDADNRVRFAAIETIDETPAGIWVTGLPASTRIIVEGQDFVAEGTEVNAVTESGTASNRTSPLASSVQK